jgi:hypothetical protein
MSDRWNKRERVYLRDLAAQAHQIELESALDELQDQFREWKEHKQDAFELNEKIHKFHDGTSRELYKDYVWGNAETAVAVAISKKVIEPSNIEENILDRLQPLIEMFSRIGKPDNDGAT